MSFIDLADFTARFLAQANDAVARTRALAEFLAT